MAVSGQAMWSLAVQVEAHREDGEWVATCPVLGVASQGSSRKEALAMLKEALMLFVETCSARGTLWAVLEKKGLALSPVTAVSNEPPPAAARADWLDIPLYLLPDAGTQASVR